MTYNEGLASLAARAKWTRGFLWAFIAISVLGIPIGLTARFVQQLSISPVVAGIVTLIYLGLSLLVSLALLAMIPAWTYRAWANLHVLGLSGLGYRPGWAAGSYFVPIAGLFVPFLAMRELFNRSTGETEDHARASAPDVTSWWACYLAGVFVTAFILMTAIFNLNGAVFIVTSPMMDFVISIFANLLLIGAAWFLLRTIRDITVAQASSAGISETFA
ncbi:MAG: DUF4328 domain-containing protein [Candidatus Andeanibacterium colombiense]|uniref:DUF4328 domain-containing protein n=1 Tax=Candidatus Andeanibacterium colombiense TaxID=3121345 RepID=A0AAJ5X527_9SPHN|nr:MAG: DUF4328 domain-containing protein [Sphingomonadaceae bacterium]